MLEPFVVPVVNRLLRTNSWALERLSAHVGKTVLIDAVAVVLRLAITESGELAAAPADAPADATIAVTPALLLRLAMRDENAWREATVSGDVELAAAIDYVRRHIEWDYEEDLSRIVGDIPAHRLANSLRSLDRWGRNATLDIARAFAEYATYERPLVASPHALEEFARGVDEVRDHAERLEKRLEILQRRRDSRRMD